MGGFALPNRRTFNGKSRRRKAVNHRSPGSSRRRRQPRLPESGMSLECLGWNSDNLGLEERRREGKGAEAGGGTPTSMKERGRGGGEQRKKAARDRQKERMEENEAVIKEKKRSDERSEQDRKIRSR